MAHRQISPLTVPVAVVLSFCAGGAHAQVANTIQVTSSRDSLRADGYSRAVVTAEVRDGSGRIVPDGTEVRFSATLGNIDPIATTEAGRARVNLTSAATPGFASITVSSGQAFREFRILYLSEGDRQPERANVIPIEAEYVAYSSDTRILEGLGRVTVRMGRMTILADRVQLDVDRNRIVAECAAESPGLTVTDGKTTWLARKLVYDWPRSQGLMQQEEGLFEFIGPPLTLGKPPASPPPDDTFQMVDLDEETTMWITAKRAAVFPNQRIHFKGAQLRPAGKKVLSLPFQSLPLNASGTDVEQFVGLGSQGLTLDIPYYVSLTDKSATSVRLGWNQTQGSMGATNPGLGLDLRHRMFSGERGEDTLNLSRIASKDWGAWYRHNRNWSNNFQTSGYVEFPAHRDLFAAGNAYFQSKNFTSAISASLSDPQGFTPTTVADLSLESRPKRLGKSGLNYSLISSSGFTHGSNVDNFRQTVSVRASMPNWRLSKKTTSSSSFSVGQVLAGYNTGLTADAFVSLNHRFNNRTYLTANYNFTERPGMYQFGGKHRLGATFFTTTDRMSFYTSLARTLDGGTTSVISSLDYTISPRLRLGVRNMFFDYGYTYSDQEFSLTTSLINRPFTIYWSRQRHRFVVEFAQLVF
jgi:hypothetical protein